MEETKLLALKCPGCGAPLKINSTIRDFACTYCGSAVQVERGEGIASLHLLKDALHGVKQGTDKTAAELAIRRLTDEMQGLERERIKRDAEYTEVWNLWKSKLDAIGNQNPMILLCIVAVCVGAFVYAVTSGICWAIFEKLSPARAQALRMVDAGLPDGYVTFALLVATVAVGLSGVYVMKTIARGNRNQLKQTKEFQARALAGPENRCAEVRKRMEAVQQRLARNQELVDS